MSPAYWVAGMVLALLCAAGTVLDIRRRALPNWLSLAVLIAGLAASWALGEVAAIPWHLLHMIAALAVGMGLFALRVVGGGDAKFYAACAVWFAFGDGLRLLFAVAFAGLAALALWFLWRRAREIEIAKRAQADGDKFPYGIAIGAGAVLTWFWPAIF